MRVAKSKALYDVFIDELRDMYSAEKQIQKALPRMARAATAPTLRAAFDKHLDDTREQIGRVEDAFAELNLKPRGIRCEGVGGILHEGANVIEAMLEPATRDAALAAAAQRVEHYQMAAYGSLIAWADVLGHSKVSRLLQKSLTEDKAADSRLTELAETRLNAAAAAESDAKSVSV